MVFAQIKEVMRDFVFGMEDGLVSNLGLVLGVYVGGGANAHIVLAGLASMFAGAFSMSAGSYLSAKAQREVYEQEICAVKEELRNKPKKSLQEMCGMLHKEGFDKDEVKMLCQHFTKHNKSSFTQNFIQKKLGFSERRLELPWQNALMMFLSFLAGSIVPIVPFVLWENGVAALVAGVLTILTLFLVGVAKTLYTKRPWFKSGMEIVLIGALAGVIGYVVGVLFRVVS